MHLRSFVSNQLCANVYISRISEYTKVTHLSPVWDCFTSPGIDTRKKWPSAFSVSSERHRQMPKFRNGSRWDWITVLSIDSPALYQATTALHTNVLSCILLQGRTTNFPSKTLSMTSMQLYADGKLSSFYQSGNDGSGASLTIHLIEKLRIHAGGKIEVRNDVVCFLWKYHS